MRAFPCLLLVISMTTGPFAAHGARPAAKPIASAAPASVPSGPQPKAGISHVLGLLDWGNASAAVLDTIRLEVTVRYEAKFKELRDPLEIDRAMRRKAEELAAIDKTLVHFTGQRTGYESSLIAHDFVSNADEAMLRVDDAEAQRYYFFRNDRLWKVLVAYSTSASRNVPFGDFVRQVQEKHGRPTAVDWSTPKGGAKALRAAHWEDATTHLVAEDRTEFFGTFCMKFLDRTEGLTLEAARAQRPESERATDDPGVASALAEITSDGAGSDDTVVDRLTGTQHSVDLVNNRPDYETTLDRGAVESPIYVETKTPKSDKKKKKGKAAAKGTGSATAAPASKPAEKKSTSSVIIY